MAPKTSPERVAFSPREFAALFGKSQTWGYRQIYAQKVKAVTEYGRILIPAAEVERILGKAAEYSGSKSKPPKGKANVWRRYVEARRRKAKGQMRISTDVRPIKAHKSDATMEKSTRAAALERLWRR